MYKDKSKQQSCQLRYYYRKKQKFHCPDCGKNVCQEGRRCNSCSRFNSRPDWQKGIGINRRYATSRNGAYYIHIKVNGKWIPEHRYIWEQTHGIKVPPNHAIHHLDGDKLNNSPNNLYALTKQDHHSSKLTKILQDRIKGLQKEIELLRNNNYHLL